MLAASVLYKRRTQIRKFRHDNKIKYALHYVLYKQYIIIL